MSRPFHYAGIDMFRVIAALLVVAIHTAPLASLHETADFVLTRGLGRIAVPFFFMASAFFLYAPGEDGRLRIQQGKKFFMRTGVVYAAAIALYMPLNLYTGTIGAWSDGPSMLRALLVDGTFYHLWYLPAALTGAALVGALLVWLRSGVVLAIAVCLYVIGLLGDSYYGFAVQLPLLAAFYDNVFQFSDYTRNGLFMAPMFFALGAHVASLHASERRQAADAASFGHLRAMLGGLIVFAALLTAESLWLGHSGMPRHDSMYFMLVPCLFFLFRSLLALRGTVPPGLRPLALHIYIVHPWMIVAVRGLAKAFAWEPLLIDNSIVHFMAVAVSSVAVSCGYAWLKRRLQQAVCGAAARNDAAVDRAWIEVSMTNLCRNAELLQGLLPSGGRLMAVVKANAYGHGDVETARELARIGVRAFAVATVDEGIRLRKHGIKGDIVVLGYAAPERVGELARYRLTTTLIDRAHAASLHACGYQIKVHLKVDTGMHRLGAAMEQTVQIVRDYRGSHLDIVGMYTHLAVADSRKPEDEAFTLQQFDRFDRLVDQLETLGLKPPCLHVQSSYGLLNYPQQKYDCARIGIALYGVLSVPDSATRQTVPLQPVLELKARVALVRTIAAGEGVGYGNQFVAQRETRIALLPIGYADGLPRELSCGKGEAILHGRRVPIVGRVCMDQLMVDVSGVPEVSPGDIAVLIGGGEGEERIAAEQVAAAAGTITNELLSRLGQRLPRVVRDWQGRSG